SYCGHCGHALSARLPTAVPPYRAVPPLLWAVYAASLVLFMVVMGGIAYLLGPGGYRLPTCPPNCQPPPVTVPALSPPHRYSSSAFGYSLDWYDPPEGYPPIKVVVQDDRSIGWTITAYGYDWPYTFTGEPANGHTAQEIVEAIQANRFGNAKLVYTIPGAELGYVDGYGNVYDVRVSPPHGASLRGRLIIVVAVRKGLAVEMVSVGPYIPDDGRYGHPNPAGTPIPFLLDPLANSITWPGETPR
ncbi:MAG TPA: hypothetical protein VK131_04725, partial [Candidatus Acidoferrales bacterium]|nr:hypothetical protein [Candidatus Acidoferrales bacterium]